MAASPRNIVYRLGIALDGQPCTMKDLRRAFFNAGYGPNKTSKWINLYLQEGILKDTDLRNDKGELLFDCEWFCKPEWLKA